MGKQVMVDNDVIKELIDRTVDGEVEKALVSWAIDSGKFNSEYDGNEVLRAFLGMNNKEVDVDNNYPSSKVDKIQNLLDGLRDTIFSISKDGMKCHNNRRWVANPNVVTITVQDARAHNLRITVYGRPNEFEGIKQSLEIKEDMSGYSRFVTNNESQLPSVIKVIQNSYKLKKDRGRL